MGKENYILVGIGVLVVLVILGIIFIPDSNDNSNNEITCNFPYIKVGNSCCLDGNSNNICDSDEEENKLEDFDFYVYADRDGLNQIGTKHPSEETLKVYKTLNQYTEGGELEEGYGWLFLHIFTEESNGESFCNILEYYDGDFNAEFNKKLEDYNSGYLGTFIMLLYEKDKKPSNVEYKIKCKRLLDYAQLEKSYLIHIDYSEESFSE